MKKLILTLAILTASLTGFSQTFNYELKSWALNGSLSVGADSTKYPIIVVVGIVGEPHGFLPPNPGQTCTFVATISNLLNVNQINTMLNDKAIAFVKKNYPAVK